MRSSTTSITLLSLVLLAGCGDDGSNASDESTTGGASEDGGTPGTSSTEGPDPDDGGSDTEQDSGGDESSSGADGSDDTTTDDPLSCFDQASELVAEHDWPGLGSGLAGGADPDGGTWFAYVVDMGNRGLRFGQASPGQDPTATTTELFFVEDVWALSDAPTPRVIASTGSAIHLFERLDRGWTEITQLDQVDAIAAVADDATVHVLLATEASVDLATFADGEWTTSTIPDATAALALALQDGAPLALVRTLDDPTRISTALRVGDAWNLTPSAFEVGTNLRVARVDGSAPPEFIAMDRDLSTLSLWSVVDGELETRPIAENIDAFALDALRDGEQIVLTFARGFNQGLDGTYRALVTAGSVEESFVSPDTLDTAIIRGRPTALLWSRQAQPVPSDRTATVHLANCE